MLSCQRSVGFYPIANVHKHSVWVIFWYWIVLLHWPTPTPLLSIWPQESRINETLLPRRLPSANCALKVTRSFTNSKWPSWIVTSNILPTKTKRQNSKYPWLFFWKKSPTLLQNFVHGLHKLMHSMPGAAQISCIGRGPSFAKLLQDSFKAFGLRLDNFKPFSKQPFRTNLLTKPVFDNVANFGALPREHAKKAALMPWGPGASTLASSSNKHRITSASIVSPCFALCCVLVCP